MKNISYDNYYKQIFGQIDLILEENYLILDCHDLLFDKPESFGDITHVNYFGAEILSKQINKDLQELEGIELSTVMGFIKGMLSELK